MSILNVIFDYVTTYSDILPAILFLFAVTKHKDKGLWVLFWLNLYSFVNNLVILNDWYVPLHLNNYVLFRCFTVLGYTLIAYFFYLSISSPKVKKTILISFFLFLGYAIYDFLKSPLESFDSIPSAIEAILIIIFSIFYLFEQIRIPKVFFIYTLDKFWIITSFLVYFTGTFFLFILAESYMNDPAFVENYVTINNLFLLFKNIFFSIGLLIRNKDNEYSPNSYPQFENYLEKRF